MRSDQPWSMNAGYDGMPEATAAAWRNGWFHTGDLFRQDADGDYFFVDRIKDTVRRRGENISSFEVEAARAPYPDVDEVLAVGVQSEIAEQEVLVAVTSSRTAGLDPRALIEFLIPRLALLHGAAVRALRRGDSEDRNQQGPQGCLPRPGHYGRHLGPRKRRHHAAPRQALDRSPPP